MEFAQILEQLFELEQLLQLEPLLVRKDSCNISKVEGLQIEQFGKGLLLVHIPAHHIFYSCWYEYAGGLACSSLEAWGLPK